MGAFGAKYALPLHCFFVHSNCCQFSEENAEIEGVGVDKLMETGMGVRILETPAIAAAV